MGNVVIEKIEKVLTSEYSIQNYVEFIQEVFGSVKLIAPDRFRKEFTNFSSHIVGSSHVGNYTDPEGKKLIIFSVQLLNKTYVEISRSTQRSYAKKLIESAGADGALIAFYTEGDPKWRISLVRLDYEIKFENGKLKTTENMTPAKRYSYLVGKDEPCHTAVDRFRRFITDQNFNPTLDDLEEAFSVEAVTNEFFNLYCEKYKQLLVHLEDNPDFVMEAQLHNFTAAQFAKKLMGQIVFLYFLQKKGWLGVGAWPNTMNEKEYKNAYYAKGNKSRELIPKVYLPMGDGTYHLSVRALETISDEDETVLAQCVKGKPWGSGPHNFMRKLFEVAEKKGANFFDDYLEPLFYNVLNVNRGEQGYDPELHCRIPFLAGGLFEPIDGYEWEHNDFAIPNEIFSNRINNNPRTGDGILDIFDRYNFTMSEDEPMEREVAIDPEMLGKVFENLLEVNDRKAKGAFYTPREIVHYMCQETLINYIKNAINVSEEAVRDFILHGDLMKDEDTVKEKRLGNGEMLISEELYKLDSDGNILVNKLVDMDRALAEVRVADPAVGSGAFPLGMLNEIVRTRQNISAYMAITMRPNDIRLMYSMERSPHNLKYETIKNCIYAADIDPSAVDITQLRLWLSLVIDDETNPEATNLFEGHKNPLPLPNLESNILCGNSLMDEFEGVPLVNYSAIIGNLKNNQQINLYQSGFDSILPKLLEVQDKLFRCNETEKKKELLKEISALKEMIVRSQFEGRDDFNVWDRFKESTHLVSKPYVLWQMDFARVFKEKGGFDIVIGNPPYVQMSKVAGTPESYKEYLRRRYGTSGGRLNLYIFMIHLGVELLNCKGVIAYIIPNTILTQDYYTDTRKMLLENHSLLSIVDYSDMPFENAVVENVTIIANKKHLNDYKVNVLKGTSKNIQAYKQIDVKNFKMQKTYAFNINSNELVEKMFTDSAILKDYCNINQAIALKGDKSISVKEEYRPEYYKLLDGRNINKYGIKWGGAYLDYSLERIHSCKRRDIFECDEKLFFRRVSATIIATYDNEQYYALNTLVVVTAKKPIQLKYILALLNSKLMNYIYSNKFKSTKTVFSEIQARSVGELPIKFSTAYENKIIEIVDEILTLKKNNFEYDTTELEKEIDELVYKIYGLNEKEIEIVEKLPIGRKK
ncbi:hypothetical protein HMPREF1215_02270 [Coprococcus sp. HPP0074]|nr:hypothetical protein HMPREF1215_02270 [Coprococcus sp. HPP0074]